MVCNTNNIYNYNSKIAFDCEKYKNMQKNVILERYNQNDDNSVLYIEVGGKIINDFHSTRVLPGYRPDLKFEFINELFPDAEFICCISAKDLERKRERDDFKLSYDKEIFRLIEELKEKGKTIKKIVITRIDRNNKCKNILQFIEQAEKLGFETIKFYENEKYKPTRKLLMGLSENPFIKTNAKQIVITAPGAGSGKFATCLSQLYHEMKNNIAPQYIKIETFPVYNLPLTHLLNKAYISATADFGDKIMFDKNSSNSTSYNRDIENFKLLKFITTIFDEKVTKYLKKYNSPTSMGINCIKDGIINDALVQKESGAEITRRFIGGYQSYIEGKTTLDVVKRLKKVFNSIPPVLKYIKK